MIKIQQLIVILLCTLSAQARPYSPKKETPKQSEQNSAEKRDNIAIVSLKGLLLVGSNKSIRVSALEGIEGVQTECLKLPGSASSLDQMMSEYWCKTITKQDVIDIKRKVILYYRLHNRPVIQVVVPAQAAESGVLQLVVQESRMGELHVTGNRYFNSKKLKSYIQVKKGGAIESGSLISDLNWINRNPFRTTDMIFKPSKNEGYADIELVTKDQFPLRVYVGVDNTGIAQSGHDRWFTGLNWGNCFGLEHIFTYQFTTGNHYNEFWAHSVDYTAPLSWRHTLDLYGGYSQVSADVACSSGVSKTMGSSAQASLRYEIPLPPGLSILEEFVWGFDWKRMNTNLLNNDIFFFGQIVNLSQIMVGYNAGLKTLRTKNSITIEIFCSPGQWLPDQKNRIYNNLRTGAKNVYVYGRASVASVFRLPSNFTFEPSIRYQLSSANLLATEQFGLGGHDTVRGYAEREFNADNALVANLEFRTPSISLFSFSQKWKKKLQDELKFLVFFDYGYGKNHKRISGEKEFQYLMGTGPGLRYVIPKYLTVRLDYGWKLKQLSNSSNPLRHMLYFGIVFSL